MIFIVEGYVVPYVRMTHRSKFASDRAKRYLNSKEATGWQIKMQMIQNGWSMIPKGTPLEVSVAFHGYDHTSDLSNLYKAVEDAMNGIVYSDDRWVDKQSADRYAQPENQRAIIKVGVLHEFSTDQYVTTLPAKAGEHPRKRSPQRATLPPGACVPG